VRLFLLGLSVAAVCAAGPARAEGSSSRGDDEALLALAVGASTVIAPVAIGGARAGRTDIGHVERDQGWIAASVGFALAPITAHIVTGEYGRGAAFAAVPVATTIGVSALFAAYPDAIYTGNPASRIGFVVLFVTGATGSAVGVIDAVLASERRAKHAAPERSLSFDVGPGSLGLRGAW
jgi:hypothetical protein